jgi:cell shape-determining protein MreC
MGSRLGPVVQEVLQDDDVQEGDLILTSGEGDWLPDLLVGQVKTVGGREAELYKTVALKLLLDYQNLRVVFVVVDF